MIKQDANLVWQEGNTPPPEVCPLFPDAGIVAVVANEWGTRWHMRHHVLSRLAQYFHVVWMNPARGWREVVRGRNGSQPAPPLPPQAPGFMLYKPEPWLPVFYRPQWLGETTFRMRLERARRRLHQRGCRKTILYVWRPEFAPALRLLAHDVSCYHIHDEYSFSETEAPIGADEMELLNSTNQVFIHSPALMEKKGHFNPHTLFVPNGVDFNAYAAPSPEPADLAAIPHPRIGYTGVIKPQLDWKLLTTLVETHPEWSFVFVGPVHHDAATRETIGALDARPNVHFLGEKTVWELTAYPQHFDVCIMPYRRNDYTKYIFPLKLNEFLASGRPVVGTRLRSLETFANVIFLPATAAEWPAAITAALCPSQQLPDCRAARQAVARKHDWDLLVRRIATALAERLGPEYSARFHQAAPATAG